VSFFVDPNDRKEIANLSPLAEADLQDLESKNPAYVDHAGRKVIKIDCMLFLLDDLASKGFVGPRWTNGDVHYEFDNNVTPENRRRWLAAADEWAKVANVRFRPRSGRNFIHVKDSAENLSYVGMIGGRQDMDIHNWDWKYIICHEIGHALGRDHEHCRSDRDRFVAINWHNIESGKEHAFKIRNSMNYTTYDFCSIMHYDRYAFSDNNLPTIAARAGYEQDEHCMGNRRYMSPSDASGMAHRYGARRFRWWRRWMSS
jgi:hypothetical protein